MLKLFGRLALPCLVVLSCGISNVVFADDDFAPQYAPHEQTPDERLQSFQAPAPTPERQFEVHGPGGTNIVPSQQCCTEDHTHTYIPGPALRKTF